MLWQYFLHEPKPHTIKITIHKAWQIAQLVTQEIRGKYTPETEYSIKKSSKESKHTQQGNKCDLYPNFMKHYSQQAEICPQNDIQHKPCFPYSHLICS